MTPTNLSWTENVSLAHTDTEILIFDNRGHMTFKMKVVQLSYSIRYSFFGFFNHKNLFSFNCNSWDTPGVKFIQVVDTLSEYRLRHKG